MISPLPLFEGEEVDASFRKAGARRGEAGPKVFSSEKNFWETERGCKFFEVWSLTSENFETYPIRKSGNGNTE